MKEKEFRAAIPSKDTYTNNIQIDKKYLISHTTFFKQYEYNEVNKIMIDICMKIFDMAYQSGGKEAGAILNIGTGEYSIHEATRYGSIDFADDENADYYKLSSNSNNYSCIFIHTHNSIEGFSLTDIRTFVLDDKAIAIVVIKADASINIMIKDINKNYEKLKEYLGNIYNFNFMTPEIREEIQKYDLFEGSLSHD
jgi:hypothetical protein